MRAPLPSDIVDRHVDRGSCERAVRGDDLAIDGGRGGDAERVVGGQVVDFADAYVCAAVELLDVEAVASFDRSVGRVTTVRRVEP